MLGYEKITSVSTFQKGQLRNKLSSYKIMGEAVKYHSLISLKSEGKIQYYIVQ